MFGKSFKHVNQTIVFFSAIKKGKNEYKSNGSILKINSKFTRMKFKYNALFTH